MERAKWRSAVVLVLVIAAVTLFVPRWAAADNKLNAAVVAGFMLPFEEIAAVYQKKTGVKVRATFSSAGRLYGQIINGAPHDIFLSADKERPDLLHSRAISEKPFTYATGEVILWFSDRKFCGSEGWRSALARKDVGRIAIPNPETAVYGLRAQGALKDAGLWDSVSPRLIYAPDLSQVFQYATEGAVDAAFCSLAHARTEKGKTGCYYEMKGVPAVIHSACVLKNAKDIDRARHFAAFLVSLEGERIIKKYGYNRSSDRR
jgi:molybdate transport system substrate-binding protein